MPRVVSPPTPLALSPQLAAALRRRRWRRSDALAVLSAYQTEGGTLADFARRYQVDLHRLSRWRSRLDRTGQGVVAGAAAPTAPRLLPLQVTTAPAAAGLDVHVASARVVVRAGFDPELLRAVVRALGPDPC